MAAVRVSVYYKCRNILAKMLTTSSINFIIGNRVLVCPPRTS